MNQEVNNALKILKAGGLILYPTDTVWSIGCDATNPDAVHKIFKLKQREDSKASICLVVDERMLAKYVNTVPEAALNIINISDKPTTIIYDNAQNLASNLIADDESIAIRIPNEEFCFQLCRKLNGALVSSSANISGYAIPNSFKEITSEVLKGVDYVVNLHHEKTFTQVSSVIKLKNNGEVKIIRA